MKQNGAIVGMQEQKMFVEGLDSCLTHVPAGDCCDGSTNEAGYKSDEREKIRIISSHFREIMRTLGLDLLDDSLAGTPERVAKMFIKEIFSGLNASNKPRMTVFENKFGYKQMLVEKDISFYSTCEHHFVPIIGKAHVAYIPSNHLIGLSKLHRVVKYLAQRPQVQERLTVQIANELKSVLKTNDVAVVIEASHLCVASRGIKDVSSSTITAEFSGVFLGKGKREEFLSYVFSK